MELADIFRDSVSLIILVLLPIMLVALGVSFIISMLATRLGFQDPVLMLVVRTLAIAAFLLFTGSELFVSLHQWSVELWDQLAQINYSD